MRWRRGDRGGKRRPCRQRAKAGAARGGGDGDGPGSAPGAAQRGGGIGAAPDRNRQRVWRRGDGDANGAGGRSVMHLQAVRKNDSVSIPLGLFNDENHAHISAVIFNPCATWGKVRALAADPNPCVFFNAVRSDPRNGQEWVFSGSKSNYVESLFAGLRIYHKPHAAQPLDLSVFMRPDVFQGMSVNPSAGEWLMWCDRAPLVNRTVQTFNLDDKAKMDELLQKFSVTNGKWKQFQNGRIVD